MRKWALFAVLAAAIGAASWWHFSRIPQRAIEQDALDAESSNAAREWGPEVLRDTKAEVILGGGPIQEQAPSPPAPVATNLAKQDKMALPASSTQVLSKPEPAPASPSGEENYTVKSGDTLGAIAKKKYGSSAPRYVDAIVKKNSLKSADALKVGAKLVLPDPASLKK